MAMTYISHTLSYGWIRQLRRMALGAIVYLALPICAASAGGVDGRDAVDKYLAAWRADDPVAMARCFRTTDPRRAKMIEQFAQEEVAQRRLIDAVDIAFPEHADELGPELLRATEASIEGLRKSLIDSPLDVRGSEATVQLHANGETENVLTEKDSDGWKLRVDSFFHLERAPSDQDVLNRTTQLENEVVAIDAITAETKQNHFESVRAIRNRFEKMVVDIEAPRTREHSKPPTSRSSQGAEMSEPATQPHS
jgi:hypothetical protein